MRSSFCLAVLAAALPLGAHAAPVPVYAVTASIPGPDGAWDYASVDAEGAHVYIARSNAVTVIDLATGAVSSLGAVERGHSALPLPGGKLLVTSGNDGTVRLVDPVTRAETGRLAAGKKPDAAILDATGTHAYVMNGTGGTVSVIDLATAKITRTITIKPKLEFAAFDAGGTLFINNEEDSEMETVDVASGIVGQPIALPGCKAPTGLGYDSAHNRLIAACDNGKAAVVDAATHKLVDLVDIGEGPDAVIIDQARGLAFIPCGESGVLDVLSLAGPHVTHAQTVKTEIGAGTGALDARTGTLFLPTARFDPAAKSIKREAMLPGSFHVLVVQPPGMSAL